MGLRIEHGRASPVYDLAIVIPNWNGAAVLSTCLESLSCHLDCNSEVIVFDNGSTDDSVQIAQEFSSSLNLRIIRCEANLGFAGACNQAVPMTDARYVLLLNNDTKMTGGMLAAIRYLDSSPAVAACQGPILTADGRYVDSAGSAVTSSGFLSHLAIGAQVDALPPTRPVFAVKGAAIFVRRAALDDLGLFDPDAFAYFEESDLSWRLWIGGWKVMYVKELSPILHTSGYTAARLPNLNVEYHVFKNRLRSILKNADCMMLVTMLPRHMALCIAASVDALINGAPGRMRSIMDAVLWNVRHLRDTLRFRREVQASRRVSDRAIFADLSTRMRLFDFYRQRTPVAWRKQE